jgi:hypothetical protein
LDGEENLDESQENSNIALLLSDGANEAGAIVVFKKSVRARNANDSPR